MESPKEKPNRMGPEAYLVMRGWRMYVIEEAAAERRRLREADDPRWLLADTGARFEYERLGISNQTLLEALGGQLIREARDLGGFERFVEVLETARARPPRSGGNGDGKRPPGLE